MTASGDPAVWMRLEMSGRPEAESCDGRCECIVLRDTFEIAESMDEVRGIGRPSGRFSMPAGAGDVVDRGDGGKESPGCVACSKGDETFRSWLYEWAFGGDAVACLMEDPSMPPVIPFTYVFPIPRCSSRREPDCFGLLPRLERGD